MHLSAAICRAQEAVQLAKAENEPLESRRIIALTAAKAWAAEAALAERRALKQDPLDKLDAEIAEEFALEAEGITPPPA